MVLIVEFVILERRGKARSRGEVRGGKKYVQNILHEKNLTKKN